MDIRIPTPDEILENPRRRLFIAGGWINDSEPDVVYVYWHRHQKHFTVHSLLRILEHETLHSVLARRIDLGTSVQLDNVHDASPIWLENGRLIFESRFEIHEQQTSAYDEVDVEKAVGGPVGI